MKRKQAYNPFLPLDEYIPDAEPHVFGDRVYLYGSHDKEAGHTFCMLDYVVYSAPVTDLADWRFEGVSYSAEKDPAYPRLKYMYAPDVVRGNNGNYYLYYCMAGEFGENSYTGPVSVAVSDSPCGPFEYLGHVRNSDGSVMMRYICFDPAVMNDGGTIRLYYGTSYGFEEENGTENVLDTEKELFGRTEEELLSYPDSIMGAVMLTLDDDMLTVKDGPRHIIPYAVRGTSFEGHPFFEASSIRKADGRYYFIYSSRFNHELCYAVSSYPDRDFVFGGTLVSNADIGYEGRPACDMLNMTGTTHGSIEKIGGKWYVFYHRLTHKSDYSRQACAEEIQIRADGSICQAEITSCGLNGGPLEANGTYPAVIACNLTNGNMPHGSNSLFTEPFPNITSSDGERFIAEIEEGTLIGFKYFSFSGVTSVSVTARAETDENRVVFEGPSRETDRTPQFLFPGHRIKNPGNPRSSPALEIRLSETGPAVAFIEIDGKQTAWRRFSAYAEIPDGVHPLYFVYHGGIKIQLKEIIFG